MVQVTTGVRPSCAEACRTEVHGLLCAGGALANVLENDCLISVEEHAVLDVPADGTRQHYLFKVAPFAHQILHCVSMRHSNHILFDDRTVVENFGDVVTGSPDQLHASFKRLMVGAGAHK